MPMIDITIPEGALAPHSERRLLARLTDVLLEHEGADPASPVARSLAWVFLHRPGAVYVAGEPVAEPRYRVVASVPEGQFDDDRRAAMVAAVTGAVLDAEGGTRPRDPARVWVFAHEVPDGTWGAGGRVARLGDIVGMVLQNVEHGRRYAQARLGARAGRMAHCAPAAIHSTKGQS
jgi:phenylpyruvate tautomerase PptA (4-oxalocrotonate tautomerase family)